MIKTPIHLQDLRRKIYTKAKADTAWRFWGLYVHVCKMETLHEAYALAKKNNGAPGIDGVTFEAIEDSGVEAFLKQIQDELAAHTYQRRCFDRRRKSGRSHLEFLHRLLTDQAGLRRQRSIERRIKDAHFRELKPLSDFDWNFNPSLPRTQIETLVACDFVRRCQNLVFVGQSGLGKSRLIQNIGQAACVQGYRVFYTTSGALLENLTAALADQTIHDRVRFYARFELLIIDEFGLDRIERSLCPQAASLWYKIIDARSQRVSTALVTNIDFESWAEYLGDAPLAMALLDRVVDGATIVKLKGKSYRLHRGSDEPSAK